MLPQALIAGDHAGPAMTLEDPVFDSPAPLAPRLSLVALVAMLLLAAGAGAVSVQSSTILDPVGDALYQAPAFQDFVSGQMTMTAGRGRWLP